MKFRTGLTLLAIIAIASPAAAGEKVCLGGSWAQLNQQQKTTFLNEFRASGGTGDPSSCSPSAQSRSTKGKPQPQKAQSCLTYCTSDQAAITTACTLSALFLPAIAAACAALSPVYSSACKATCEAKYGPAPQA